MRANLLSVVGILGTTVLTHLRERALASEVASNTSKIHKFILLATSGLLPPAASGVSQTAFGSVVDWWMCSTGSCGSLGDGIQLERGVHI